MSTVDVLVVVLALVLLVWAWAENRLADARDVLGHLDEQHERELDACDRELDLANAAAANLYRTVDALNRELEIAERTDPLFARSCMQIEREHADREAGATVLDDFRDGRDLGGVA